jgi:hypothetical protein
MPNLSDLREHLAVQVPRVANNIEYTVADSSPNLPGCQVTGTA